MASQFAAVRGKRPRYNYIDAINAQGQFLPAQYATKKSAELEKQSFDLQKEETAAYKQHLTSMDAFNQANLSFLEKQGKQAKKDSRIANILGLGKLGSDVYFAQKSSKAKPVAALKGVLGGGSPAKAVGPFAALPGNVAQPTSLFSQAKNYLAPNQGVSDLFGAGAMGGFGKAFNFGNVLTGGGAGALASSLLTDKDDSKLKKAGIGAAAGGLANYLGSGGDLFSSAIGAAFGGGGGLFDFF